MIEGNRLGKGAGFINHKKLKSLVAPRNHLNKQAYWDILKVLREYGIINYSPRGVKKVEK